MKKCLTLKIHMKTPPQICRSDAMKNIPFIAVGNDEFKAMPDLGKTVKCWICGKRHKVECSDAIRPDGTKDIGGGSLSFFKCGDNACLCGINGKEWKPKK